jgi:hypothetical protein
MDKRQMATSSAKKLCNPRGAFYRQPCAQNFKHMLEYAKTILQKVSFDLKLFEKELRKAIASLLTEEISILRAWCYEKFGKEYETVLNHCFAQGLQA